MIWTALIMGLTGSLHCAGMCSPLLLAATSNGRAMQNRLIYNFGRILMYGLLGLLLGSVASLLAVDQLRNGLTIALGLGLLVMSCLGLSSVRIPIVHPILSKVLLWFKKVFASVLRQHSVSGTLLLGFLNGILPCGLTFAALLVGLTLGPLKGAVFMVMFGVGTLPVMIGFTGWLQHLIRRYHFSPVRVASVLLFVSGCLLISRGIVQHYHGTTSSHENVLVDMVLCR
jgi:sulfite exporter TauE/SafE